MRAKDVRAVAFDVVGTLIHPEPVVAEVYAAAGRRHGSRRTADQVRARFAAAFARQEEADLADGLRTDEERERRRWRQIVSEVLDDAADPAGCFEELYRHFARPDAWRCGPDVPAVLEELSRRGYLLALASNFDGRLRQVAAMPELRPVSRLVISSEVGWRKPAPAFFAALCRALEMSRNEVLLVGDDRANDHEGAAACGMPSVLYDPRGRHPDVAPRITSLRELLALLPGD